MKKLIAILAVFALLTTAVFAEANIGGGVGFGAKLLYGDSIDKGKDADGKANPSLFTALTDHWVSVDYTWQSDENTSGGKIKMNGNVNKNGGDNLPAGMLGGRVWWKPLDMLRVEFTNLENEGVFGRGNAIDWGYQANSSSGKVAALWDGGWNSFSNATLRTGTGFFSGLGGGGQNVLALSLTPIDGLAVNLAWALGDEDILLFFKGTVAQVTYSIGGIGNFALSFKGEEGNSIGGYRRSQTLAFDFTLTALAGMGIEIGAKIPLGGRDAWDKGAEAEDWGGDYAIPMEIGLGYTLNQWSGEAFQLFARIGAYLPTEDSGNITAFGLDVNPSYNIGIFRVFFDFGVALAMQKDNDDTDFFWHFNPYLRKNIGVGDFYFGINLWNGVTRDGYETLPSIQGPGGDNKPDGTNIINFAVPIYFEISF